MLLIQFGQQTGPAKDVEWFSLSPFASFAQGLAQLTEDGSKRQRKRVKAPLLEPWSLKSGMLPTQASLYNLLKRIHFFQLSETVSVCVWANLRFAIRIKSASIRPLFGLNSFSLLCLYLKQVARNCY